jgi:hypothetical protein
MIPNNLDEIVKLAQVQIRLEKEVAQLEEALSKKKAALREVSEVDIPEALVEAGRISEIKLEDGTKIKVNDDFVVGIPPSSRAAAFAWLEKEGYDGLIKTEVVVEYGRGEMANAVKLLQELIGKRKLTASLERDIHWQTLKAFVKEQTKKRGDFPLALFGAVPVKKTKVTLPKG